MGTACQAVNPLLGRVKTSFVVYIRVLVCGDGQSRRQAAAWTRQDPIVCHICYVQCRATAGQRVKRRPYPSLVVSGRKGRGGEFLRRALLFVRTSRGNSEYVVKRYYNSITLGIRHGDGGE